MDVVGLDNCHTCRGEPFEAAVYSLEAKGAELTKFRANSKATLTVEVEETPEPHKSALEIPVDFTKDDVAKVKKTFLPKSIIFKNDRCENRQ